ncbi:hypothetical protein V5799_024923, partial [Amblyomma americanum]
MLAPKRVEIRAKKAGFTWTSSRADGVHGGLQPWREGDPARSHEAGDQEPLHHGQDK